MRTLGQVMEPEDLSDANTKLKKTSAGFFKELFETFGQKYQKEDGDKPITHCRQLKNISVNPVKKRYANPIPNLPV